MYQWERQIQSIVDEIDRCIRQQDSEALTLQALSRRLGYSESYTTRKFGEISGMRLRDYLRGRRLAFALKEVRDSEKSLLCWTLRWRMAFPPKRRSPGPSGEPMACPRGSTGATPGPWCCVPSCAPLTGTFSVRRR